MPKVMVRISWMSWTFWHWNSLNSLNYGGEIKERSFNTLKLRASGSFWNTFSLILFYSAHSRAWNCPKALRYRSSRLWFPALHHIVCVGFSTWKLIHVQGCTWRFVFVAVVLHLRSLVLNKVPKNVQKEENKVRLCKRIRIRSRPCSEVVWRTLRDHLLTWHATVQEFLVNK